MRKSSKKTLQTNRKIVAVLVAIAAIIIIGVGATLLFVNRSGEVSYAPVTRFGDIHGLAVDPKGSNVLYVATHQGLVRGVESNGTWSWALVGNYRADLMGFTMNPDGKTFYASGHKAPETPNIGVARSDDGGLTWKIIALRGRVDFHTMTLSHANPHTLYAWYYGDGRLHRSTDGGHSWSSLQSRNLIDVLALAADPTEVNVLWAATKNGLFRSTDGGESFELASFGRAPVVAVAVDPTNPETLYVSSTSGLQKSTDGGQSWQSLNLAAEISHLAIDSTNPSVVYAATYTAAIYRSTDGGSSWRIIKQAEK